MTMHINNDEMSLAANMKRKYERCRSYSVIEYSVIHHQRKFIDELLWCSVQVRNTTDFHRRQINWLLDDFVIIWHLQTPGRL